MGVDHQTTRSPRAGPSFPSRTGSIADLAIHHRFLGAEGWAYVSPQQLREAELLDLNVRNLFSLP